MEIIDHSKDNVFEKNQENFPKPPGEIKILEHGNTTIDEFQIGYMKTNNIEGYEITIDAGNGVHYVVLSINTQKDFITVIEKFSNSLKKPDHIETDMKVILVSSHGKIINKVLDGRYKVPRQKLTVESLAEKIKNEGLSFLKIEKVS